MENISMSQALRVWSELWQAYYGNNGYGGDTAEIYAYTLQPRTPSMDMEQPGNSFAGLHDKVGLQAAKSLYALLFLFRNKHDCGIQVNGRVLGEWFMSTPFVHRCHVKVENHADSGQANI